jgi:hypothetical protein
LETVASSISRHIAADQIISTYKIAHWVALTCTRFTIIMSTSGRPMVDEADALPDPVSPLTQGDIRLTSIPRKPIPAGGEREPLQPISTSNPKGVQARLSEQRRKRTAIQSLRSAGWLWEVASLVVACVCAASIVIILVVIENKATPNWPYGISVTATLSALVTVMRGATGICIAGGLSQMKWLWFKQERKLIDLVVIDDASRGLMGAARLLTTLRTWYLAYLGSFVFLSAFFVGPTVQQAVTVRSRTIQLEQTASIPVCNGSSFDVGGGGTEPTLPVMGAVYSGLLQTSPQTAITSKCITGNCTFEPYQSMGICHECIDLSHEIEFFNTTTNSTVDHCLDYYHCTASFPGGALQIEPSYTRPVFFTSSYTRADHIGVDNNPQNHPENATFATFWALMRNGGGGLPFGGSPSPVAVRCKLNFCINTYTATVKSGIVQENKVATTWTGGNSDVDPGLELPARPCYVDGVMASEPWTDQDRWRCTYNISSWSITAMVKALSLTQGQAYWDNGLLLNNFSSEIVQAIYDQSYDQSTGANDRGALQGVVRSFDSLTASLTNYARGDARTCNGASVPGAQFTDELYIHIRWPWLIPMLSVIILMLGFFVATVAVNWRQELWKSSPLAFIVHQPTTQHGELMPKDLIVKEDFAKPLQPISVEVAAKNVEVRFRKRG